MLEVGTGSSRLLTLVTLILAFFLYSRSDNVLFSHDRRGRLTGYETDTIKSVYDYDKMGRRIKESVSYPGYTARHSYSY